MYEYTGCGKKGNKGMEVADHPVDLYDRVGLCNEFAGVPDFQIVFPVMHNLYYGQYISIKTMVGYFDYQPITSGSL